MFPIIYKELKVYLNSVIAYISAIFFLVVSSVWFFFIYKFENTGMADLRNYFISFPLLFTILIPSLTMKSFSDEMKTGTYELLVTYPYSELEIVMGKFLSSFILLLGILLFTLPVPISIGFLGDFDKNVVGTEYLGIILLGMICISVGQYVSSWTKNQITAFLSSVSILLVIVFMGLTSDMIPTNFFKFLNWLSLKFHFENFNKGILDLRDIIYFLSITVIFLFLNQQKILFKRYN